MKTVAKQNTTEKPKCQRTTFKSIDDSEIMLVVGVWQRSKDLRLQSRLLLFAANELNKVIGVFVPGASRQDMS
jgi:hypothetical protein